jgi:hypothetical protein
MERAAPGAVLGEAEEESMTAFRVWLIVILATVGVYTAVVIGDQGLNLFTYFLGDMAKLGWPGQFNLDFMFMLSLSGLWVAWRNRFSGVGIALGVGAFFLGAPYLSAYLLYLLAQTQGDMRAVLVGEQR